METCPRPKIGRRFSSALIMRRFFESWRPFRLMYCQSFFVTSVRGIGELPTTEASSLLGCIGFMNAAFGVRFLPEDFRLAFAGLLCAPFYSMTFWPKTSGTRTSSFRSSFLLPSVSPGLMIGCELLHGETPSVSEQTIVPRGESNRECKEFPYEKHEIP